MLNKKKITLCKLFVIVLTFFFLLPVKNFAKPNTLKYVAAPYPTKKNRIQPSTKTKIIELQKIIRTWVEYCGGHLSYNFCDQGDMALFSGLNCLSGEKDRCEDVRLAQDETGRWWRSPLLINGKRNNSFSRDMSLGVLSYLVVSKDKAAAKKWLNWIETNNKKPGCLCDDDTDGRCDITLGLWGLLGEVWKHLGLKTNAKMNFGMKIDEGILLGTSFLGFSGLDLHLLGVDILLRQKTNTFTSSLQKASNVIRKREPQNPFFEYLSRGPTERAAKLTLKYCLPDKPSWTREWTWQRFFSKKVWKKQMGHDCIFLINLLLEKPEAPDQNFSIQPNNKNDYDFYLPI